MGEFARLRAAWDESRSMPFEADATLISDTFSTACVCAARGPRAKTPLLFDTVSGAPDTRRGDLRRASPKVAGGHLEIVENSPRRPLACCRDGFAYGYDRNVALDRFRNRG